jgi:hypothetical protein
MRKRFGRWQCLLCWLLAWQLVGLAAASPAPAKRHPRQDADGLCVAEGGSPPRGRKAREEAARICEGDSEFAARLCADDSSGGDGGGPACPIELGAAAACRILQLGGGDVSLAGRPGAVTGDVCMGPATRGRTQLNLVGQQVLTGDVHLGPGARLDQRKRASFQGAVHHDADLGAVLGDAALADEALAAAPCIELGRIEESRTLCGMGGLNVFCADSIELGKGEVLRLDGGPEDAFVVKVARALTLKGGARIVAGPNVPPEHVLFHVEGRGKPVSLKGSRAASSLDGTVLAPERRVQLVRSTLQGSVVSGNGIHVGNGAEVTGPSAACPSAPACLGPGVVEGQELFRALCGWTVESSCALPLWRDELGLGAAEVAHLLVAWGYNVVGIGRVLRAGYGLDALAAGQILKDEGVGVSDIWDGLLKIVFQLGVAEGESILRALGFSESEIFLAQAPDKATELARQYGPYVYVHSDEEFFPATVDYALDRVDVVAAPYDGSSAPPRVLDTDPTPETLNPTYCAQQAAFPAYCLDPSDPTPSADACAVDEDCDQYLETDDVTGDLIGPLYGPLAYCSDGVCRKGCSGVHEVCTGGEVCAGLVSILPETGREAEFKAGDLAGARAYLNILRGFDPSDPAVVDWIDLQFWMYYPFNGGGSLRVTLGDIFDSGRESAGEGGSHMADWEVVVLRFDAQSSPLQLEAVYTVDHGNYRRHDIAAVDSALRFLSACDPEDVSTSGPCTPAGFGSVCNDPDAECHVVTFASYHGHAGYPTPGFNEERVLSEPYIPALGTFTFGLVNETNYGVATAQRPRAFDTSEAFQVAAVEGEPLGAGTAWLKYAGAWGPAVGQRLSSGEAKDIVRNIVLPLLGIAYAYAFALYLIPFIGPSLAAAAQAVLVVLLPFVLEASVIEPVIQLLYQDKLGGTGEITAIAGPLARNFERRQFTYDFCPDEASKGYPRDPNALPYCPGLPAPPEPPTPAQLEVTPQLGAPGDLLTVTGLGFPADTEIAVKLGTVEVGTFVSDAIGEFVFDLTVPEPRPDEVCPSCSCFDGDVQVVEEIGGVEVPVACSATLACEEATWSCEPWFTCEDGEGNPIPDCNDDCLDDTCLFVDTPNGVVGPISALPVGGDETDAEAVLFRLTSP